MTKKKSIPQPEDLAEELNYIAMYANLQRAYEIACLGNHSIAIYYPKGIERELHHKQSIYSIMNRLVRTPTQDSAEIFIEIGPLTFDELMRGTKTGYETKKDSDIRWRKAQEIDEVEFSLDSSSKALLSTAWSRMNLTIRDYEIIKELSCTIARLNGDKSVRVEHIAEAINYRSIPEDCTLLG